MATTMLLRNKLLKWVTAQPVFFLGYKLEWTKSSEVKNASKVMCYNLHSVTDKVLLMPL